MEDFTDLQYGIMVFIKKWADTKKTPIPQSKIIEYFRKFGVESYTILNSIKTLIEEGCIRKAYSPLQQNRTFYVQIINIVVRPDYRFEWKYKSRHTNQTSQL